MVARLASIAEWYQKVAGSSPAVVKFFFTSPIQYAHCGHRKLNREIVTLDSRIENSFLFIAAPGVMYMAYRFS